MSHGTPQRPDHSVLGHHRGRTRRRFRATRRPLPLLRRFAYTGPHHRQFARCARNSVVGAIRGSPKTSVPYRRRPRTPRRWPLRPHVLGRRSRSARRESSPRSPFVERQRRRDRTLPAPRRRTHPRPQARCAHQVRQPLQGYGNNAGQEFSHPTSQITATMFVPRRVLYELRAGREYFVTKERCVFCDIIHQEERQAQRVIEARGDYLATSPYAPRVPYEAWIMPRNHEASFERTSLNKPGLRVNLAALLRRTLQRIRTVTEDFHLVLHTSPSTLHPSKNLGYWKTIDDDYHWHIEILPVVAAKAKSYTFKEVYYSPVSSETAVKHLREAKIEG